MTSVVVSVIIRGKKSIIESLTLGSSLDVNEWISETKRFTAIGWYSDVGETWGGLGQARSGKVSYRYAWSIWYLVYVVVTAAVIYDYWKLLSFHSERMDAIGVWTLWNHIEALLDLQQQLYTGYRHFDGACGLPADIIFCELLACSWGAMGNYTALVRTHRAYIIHHCVCDE